MAGLDAALTGGGGTGGGGSTGGGGGTGGAGGAGGGGGSLVPDVTVTAVEAPPRFPAESRPRTMYEYVVSGATAMFVHSVAELVPTWAPFR